MKRMFLAFLMLFLLGSQSYSEVKIDPKNRIENRNPGYCAWCCLEMIGRQQGIEKLYDLVEKRSHESDFWTYDAKTKTYTNEPYVWLEVGGQKTKELRSTGGVAAVAAKLNALGVKFKHQASGTDTSLIKYAMEKDLGCVVSLQSKGFGWKDTSGTHAVVLTKFTDEDIAFIDPNNVKHVYNGKRVWFDQYWTGYVFVVEK